MDEKVISEVIDSKYDKGRNFALDGELTVTITLAEYRELISAKAKAEQRQDTESVWQLKAENQQLRSKIADLTLNDSED